MISTKIFILLIVVLAISLRFFGLDMYPNGFSGDEAQQGYSAYSILKTGKDEWGEFLPISPRGFGDFKPPLYTYLTVPFVGLFGLNEVAVRLPSAVLSVVGIITVYFLVMELFKNKTVAIWCMFFSAINPWNIQLARTAYEGGISAFFVIGLLFFLKGLVKPKFFILTAFFWGISFYVYHAYKLFLILFIIIACFSQRKRILVKENILAAIIFCLILTPLFINFKSTLTRASDVGIFNQKTLGSYFENRGSSPLPYVLDKILDNKYFYMTGEFFKNYLSYLSPTFYFTGSRSEYSYLNFANFPLTYPIVLIFWIFTMFYFIKKPVKNSKLLLTWFFLAPIPAALSQGQMVVNRATTLEPVISIISGIGLVSFINFLQQKTKLRLKYINIAIVLIMFVNIIFFLRFYYIYQPQNPSPSLRSEYKEVFTKILELEKNYDKVFISKIFTVPQIFLAFYGKVDPSFYQESSKDWLRYERAGKLYMDQLESWNLGKYLVEDIYYKDKNRNRKNALIVSKPEDFPDNVKVVYDVKNSKGKVVYRFVESEIK